MQSEADRLAPGAPQEDIPRALVREWIRDSIRHAATNAHRAKRWSAMVVPRLGFVIGAAKRVVCEWWCLGPDS